MLLDGLAKLTTQVGLTGTRSVEALACWFFMSPGSFGAQKDNACCGEHLDRGELWETIVDNQAQRRHEM